MEGVFVVVPAFNESKRISDVMTDLDRFPWHIVIVDDGSRDNTREVALESAKAMRKARVTTLRHIVNRGQGAALQTGVRFAVNHNARFVVTFDADGQHHAEDIPKLLEPLQSSGYDIALGSRFLGTVTGIRLTRLVLLKLAVLFSRLTTGLKLSDAHNGLRAMRGDVAAKMSLSEDGMAHASEILSWVSQEALKYVEVPCRVTYNEYSLQKGQKNSAALTILFRLFVSKVTR